VDFRANVDQLFQCIDIAGLPGFYWSRRRNLRPPGTDSLHGTHRKRQLGILIGKPRNDADSIREPGISDTELGGAIGLAGKFMVGNRDDLRWQVNYGNALGRYMGLNSFNAGALDANNEISLTTQYGVLAAYRHVWNDQLHSSFGASYSRADNDPDISGFAVPESYQSGHVDIVWSPIARMILGAEYIWGRRRDESGDDGTLNRVQLSAKYLY